MKILASAVTALLLSAPSIQGQGRIGPSKGDNFRPNQGEKVMKVEVPGGNLEDLEYVEFQLPNGRGAKRLHHKPGSARGSWLGESSDGMYTMNLVNRRSRGEDHVFGSIVDFNTGVVHQLSADAEGNSVLRSTHTNDFPPEQDPEHIKGRPELEGTRFLQTAQTDGSFSLRGNIHDATAAAIDAVDLYHPNNRALADDSGSNLDVMVVWTKNAECKTSGLSTGCTLTTQTDANMRTLIDLAVAETNTAYFESGVQTELRLVHAYLDNTYTEASSNAFGTALNDIRGTSDGNMDDVHAKRTQYGADIVAMLIHDSQYCGIGYVGPSSSYMFSVTAWNCATGYYSFGHEIGHNLGCLHDKGTSNACSSSNYQYGYRDPNAQFRSIMAYNCVSGQCDGNAGGGCTRVQRFSNDEFQYNNLPLGDATTDNARRINDVKATVAAYYPVAVAGQGCQADADCDDQDPCTADVCNTSTGQCDHSNICPTSPPTGCSGGQFTWTILTDNYPAETSWTLTKAGAVVDSGDGYTQRSYTYSDTQCLSAGDYTYTIDDSWGDGICCGYGKGSYSLEIDGTSIKSGGNFASSESTQFSVGTPPDPIVCDLAKVGESCFKDYDCCSGNCSTGNPARRMCLEA